MSRKAVLVFGGTGMLRSVVHVLLDRGHTVFALARHPERAAPVSASTGIFVPVRGDWNQPGAMIDATLEALREYDIPASSIQGAIVWVHTPHREPLFDELERVLEPDATVLQLWGSAEQDPRHVMADGTRVERPWRMRHLLLGYRRDSGSARWLTHNEVSEATVLAWDTDSDEFVVGALDPWEARP